MNNRDFQNKDLLNLPQININNHQDPPSDADQLGKTKKFGQNIERISKPSSGLDPLEQKQFNYVKQEHLQSKDKKNSYQPEHLDTLAERLLELEPDQIQDTLTGIEKAFKRHAKDALVKEEKARLCQDTPAVTYTEEAPDILVSRKIQFDLYANQKNCLPLDQQHLQQTGFQNNANALYILRSSQVLDETEHQNNYLENLENLQNQGDDSFASVQAFLKKNQQSFDHYFDYKQDESYHYPFLKKEKL